MNPGTPAPVDPDRREPDAVEERADQALRRKLAEGYFKGPRKRLAEAELREIERRAA